MFFKNFLGAQELGNVVRQNIHELQNELLGFKGLEPGTASASTSEQPLEEKADKGAVIDRFTREAVVISAPSKVIFLIFSTFFYWRIEKTTFFPVCFNQVPLKFMKKLLIS